MKATGVAYSSKLPHETDISSDGLSADLNRLISVALAVNERLSACLKLQEKACLQCGPCIRKIIVSKSIASCLSSRGARKRQIVIKSRARQEIRFDHFNLLNASGKTSFWRAQGLAVIATPARHIFFRIYKHSAWWMSSPLDTREYCGWLR